MPAQHAEIITARIRPRQVATVIGLTGRDFRLQTARPGRIVEQSLTGADGEMLHVRRLKSLAIALAVLVGGASAVRADLIAYDGFNYDTSSSSALNGRTGGTGWTTAWTNNPSSTITAMNIVTVATPLSVSNAQASYTGGSQAISVPGMSSASGGIAGIRQFASQTGDVWFSFLFRTPSTVGSDDFLQFSLNNDTDQNNSASIGDTDTVASGGNDFSIRIGNTNGGTTVTSSKLIAGNTDYLLVGRVSKDGTSGNAGGTYDLLQFWVSPLDPTAPEAGSFAVSNDANSGMTSISYFTFRTANFSGTPYLFDELKIGTSYASVTPEPASLSAIALAGIALLRRRPR